MKNGWQSRKLGELARIELGKTPARASSAFWDEKRETGNVWLSIADLLNSKDNIVVDSKEYVSDKGAAMCKLVPKGTLLVSFKLTLGRLAFAGRALYTNEAIAAMTLFNERELSKEYLFWFLQFFDWVKAAENDVKLKGMTLNKAKLQKLEVHFPKSLPEQQRIVGILDAAFDGIAIAKANAEKNLHNAHDLFESHLQTVFTHSGWDSKRLGDVCRTGAGGTPLKSKKEYYEGGDIPWLMSGEVSQGEVFSATKFITRKGLENSSARIFPKDTVLVAMYGATAGQVGILKFESSTNQAICGILPNRNIVPEFLYYVYLSKKEQLVSQAVGGAQPNISQIKIKETLIPIPKYDEQQAIVAKLDTLSTETKKLEAIYQQKLAVLEELKKSLLHQAFNGEL